MHLALSKVFGSLLLLASVVEGRLLDDGNNDGELLPSYDYVVVGCGISGLVVANRLSEDDVSVLCIEAGAADDYESFIQVPQFVGSGIGSKYDWKLKTAPQVFLDGEPRTLPQGKALGGGSILNAMCWNRGGSDDYDSWEMLGNPGWSWKGLLPYFKKSETYTPVDSQEIADRFSIDYELGVHGFNGPAQVSYPKYFYNQSINFFSGLNLLGIPTAKDPNDGTTAGASFMPTALEPNNQTRSDARRTYFDPYAARSNLDVLTRRQVTRILIEGVESSPVLNRSLFDRLSAKASSTHALVNGLFGEGSMAPPPVRAPPPRLKTRAMIPDSLRITGVEYAANETAVRHTVRASREVILTAGALNSPKLLQLSGIGPQALLREHGIPVGKDLPGVGRNLQDHFLVGTFYPYSNVSISPARLSENATLNEEAWQEYHTEKRGPWTAGAPNGVAFVSLAGASNLSSTIMQDVADQEPGRFLASGTDSSVVDGFAAQKDLLVRQLSQTNNAAWEILNNNVGSLTVALMRPFSRGYCEIKSSNPFQPPLIDPRYGSNPADLSIFVEALRFNRRILDTPPMVELQPAEFVPPREADESALLQLVKDGIRTEFHPSGTCAMLPVEKGGVVDPALRVYGTQNLRVADASIFPLIPAAHLQAAIYAVAEKAADLIKADRAKTMSIGNASTAVSNSSSKLGHSLTTTVENGTWQYANTSGTPGWVSILRTPVDENRTVVSHDDSALIRSLIHHLRRLLDLD